MNVPEKIAWERKCVLRVKALYSDCEDIEQKINAWLDEMGDKIESVVEIKYKHHTEDPARPVGDIICPYEAVLIWYWEYLPKPAQMPDIDRL